MPELLVARAGPLTTVQDHGRHGTAHLGVPRAGALDRPAYLAANRLVGNAPEAAVLETTVGGVAVTANGGPLLLAVTGAPARITVDGRPAAWGAPVFLPAGATLDVGPADAGVRSYLSVAGGLLPPPVLGSRSTDLLAHLGPPPLRDGDRLPVGTTHGPPATELVPLPAMPTELVLRLLPGPRADWLRPGSLVALARSRYRVAGASNRIALRTEGPALIRSRHGELESEGMVLGAVQVPPDGQPVVFLADHPTTGGYPVIGVVPEADLPAAAQARPGTPVRFVPTTG
ncbi:biotin-dependent carboxyltransferase family protein [Kitasatospora sp. RB6PN24]|uniref:5-oxoprolinase subunit C family protein n=1 Tax=Kitasatospora humi TaxID=2893891 RepID=UPI001E5874A4|nr:biotin-dependent carboxyltransferase family protein [Kitasatospora humi]MCC9310176.1 biotin-dependent carboxyltransferase family protein [Kitasatospora humi]